MYDKHFVNGTLDFAVSTDESPDQNDFWLHIHDVYELHYFVEGDAEFVIEGQIYDLTPGTIMIMRPGELHRLVIRSPRRYRRMVFQFRMPGEGRYDRLLRPFNERSLGRGNKYDVSRIGSTIASDIFLSLNEIDFSSDSAQTELESRFLSILSYILNAFDREPVFEHIPSVMDEIVGYIGQHISDDLSLEKLENVFSCSKAQLNSYFREYTGLSTHRYITVKRLHLARTFLLRKEKPAVACRKSGFNSYSSFFKAYTGYFGRTPLNDDFIGDGLIDSDT